MFAWISGLWAPRPPAGEAELLRDERRRLEELLTCYREFGFDELAAETARKLARLARRLPGRRPSAAW